MMAALTLRPHLSRGELRLRFGYLDLHCCSPGGSSSIFSSCCRGCTPSLRFGIQLQLRSSSQYREHRSLSAASATSGCARQEHGESFTPIFSGPPRCTCSPLSPSMSLLNSTATTPGSLYDLPMVSSFLWFAFAGVIAYQKRAALDAPSEHDFGEERDGTRGESVVPARLAMAAVISLPLFAIYTLRFAHENPAVRDFRLTDCSHRLPSSGAASVPKNLSGRCRPHASPFPIRAFRRESPEAPGANCSIRETRLAGTIGRRRRS